jgi:hypothetical protein
MIIRLKKNFYELCVLPFMNEEKTEVYYRFINMDTKKAPSQGLLLFN